jgi:hypothetical protein
MNAVEAIEIINTWRRILIEGKPESIDSMLRNLEQSMAARGWGHDPTVVQRLGLPNGPTSSTTYFIGGPGQGPRLLLGLKRVSSRRLRGGSYSLLQGPHEADTAQVIEDVLKNVVTPAATQAGLKVTTPRIGAHSRIPPRTKAALFAFSDQAAGEWPLTTELEPLWRQFIFAACRDDAAVDLDELQDWFVSNGWSSEAARNLCERFLSDTELIARFEEFSQE